MNHYEVNDKTTIKTTDVILVSILLDIEQTFAQLFCFWYWTILSITWKVSRYEVFYGLNAGKYGPEKLRIWTLFMQCSPKILLGLFCGIVFDLSLMPPGSSPLIKTAGGGDGFRFLMLLRFFFPLVELKDSWNSCSASEFPGDGFGVTLRIIFPNKLVAFGSNELVLKLLSERDFRASDFFGLSPSGLMTTGFVIFACGVDWLTSTNVSSNVLRNSLISSCSSSWGGKKKPPGFH